MIVISVPSVCYVAGVWRPVQEGIEATTSHPPRPVYATCIGLLTEVTNIDANVVRSSP
jgi:hypothetical protein